MFDIEISFDRQLAGWKGRPTVVFPEALDPRVLEAACHLTRFARPVFLAPEAEVRAMADLHLGHVDPNRLEYALSQSAFVEIAARVDLVEAYARHFQTVLQAQGIEKTLEEARRCVSRPAIFGICAVALGHADTVVAGACTEPRDFYRPMLKLLRRQDFACEAGFFVLPDEHPTEVYPSNIVIFGDIGVNADMSPETLAQVAVGTCAVARDLIPETVLPEIRAAIVSHSNRGSEEGPSVELVRRASELVPGVLADRIGRGERYRSIHIEGEVRVSVALSRRSAAYYRPGRESDWSGAANVIICPNLDMGSLLYHLYATRFPNAKKFPVMFGLHFRGVSLPMDCTAEDVRLAVKASLIRLQTYGDWDRTPQDTFFRRFRVLAINPGSTSTKISVFEGEMERFTQELQHTGEELAPFEGRPITSQFHFRREAIEAFLAQNGLTVADLDAVSGRGGVLRPMPHGTYSVNEAMVEDLRGGHLGEHASNLGGLIAQELTEGTGIPAFIVDPVVVDEVPERAKITGMKAIRRIVISHALNQIATAHRYAQEHETFYERLNLIVCHMGGGITIGAHARGRYIDVNNGLDGEGPFTPQRSGSEPTGQLIDLCFSGQYTKDELKKLAKGRGGLIDLLGTANLMELEQRFEAGDAEVIAVLEAQSYQIAKWIASMVPAFDGETVDQVLLTGGMARCRPTVALIRKGLAGMGVGITIYAGENEMAALAKGALRVLGGKEPAREYPAEKRPLPALRLPRVGR
jgi:butyrate kinase